MLTTVSCDFCPLGYAQQATTSTGQVLPSNFGSSSLRGAIWASIVTVRLSLSTRTPVSFSAAWAETATRNQPATSNNNSLVPKLRLGTQVQETLFPLGARNGVSG